MQQLEAEMGSVSRRIRRAVAERARELHPDLNVTGYWILSSLLAEPKRASVIAEDLSLDKGAVSRQLSELARLGFVERTPDPVDRRANALVVTDLGRARMEAVDESRRASFAARLRSWTIEDLESLTHMLARYNAALEDH